MYKVLHIPTGQFIGSAIANRVQSVIYREFASNAVFATRKQAKREIKDIILSRTFTNGLSPMFHILEFEIIRMSDV